MGLTVTSFILIVRFLCCVLNIEEVRVVSRNKSGIEISGDIAVIISEKCFELLRYLLFYTPDEALPPMI